MNINYAQYQAYGELQKHDYMPSRLNPEQPRKKTLEEIKEDIFTPIIIPEKEQSK